MKHDTTIESPIAQMRKTGKIGGKPATPVPSEPEQGIPEPKAKKTQSSHREKLQVYVSPDLVKWVRHRAVDQKWEISEVVEEALQQYQDRVQSSL